jgi:hypothetical protein
MGCSQNAARQDSLWLKGEYTQNRVVGERVMCNCFIVGARSGD